MIEENIKEEILKCRDNPYYFATTYLKIKIANKEIPFFTVLNEKEFNELFISFNSKVTSKSNEFNEFKEFITYDTSKGHCALCGSISCRGNCFK